MKSLLCVLLLLTLSACTGSLSEPGSGPGTGSTLALLPTTTPLLLSATGPAAASDTTASPLLTITPQPSAEVVLTPAQTPIVGTLSPVVTQEATSQPPSAGELLSATASAEPVHTMPGASLTVLAQGLTSPDDLALAPDGSMYLTDSTDGTLLRYESGQAPSVLASGLSEPEGIVVLPGGDLIIAEQGKNRLVHYDPASRQITPFLGLGNAPANSGLDNFALDGYDPAGPSLLVPDSANGVLLRVSLDGKTVSQIASGFVRPVAAWAEQDGSILVADEFANALMRVRPDGTIESVASLPQPDDVIVDAAGNIYVNCLADGSVHRIAAGSSLDSVVVSGLAEPQGIAFDSQGALLVTDTGHHRLLKIVFSSKVTIVPS